MSSSPIQIPRRDAEPERDALALDGHLLGTYDCGRPGPTFVFVGGMHGNEPSGVLALKRVLQELERVGLALNGRLVCLAANLRALREGTRYVHRDLNRIWGREDIEVGATPGVYETQIRGALLEIIEAEVAATDQPVVFLDLHSTSAGGSPFSIIGDTRQNRRIAFSMPVPVILGLEENVDGALLGYFGERGHVAVGFEGGQHNTPETVDHHVAAIWMTLVAAGGLAETDEGPAQRAYECLRAAGRGLPGVVEMRYRHHVERREDFSMREGFANFDPVEQGELLAHDEQGQVCAEESGLILLPLYQGQGQDGFFLGREVRRFWLRLSNVLRAVRLGRLLPFLPGIQRLDRRGDQLEVDPRVARWWVVEIFHLLGFRRRRAVEGHLRFSRRIEGIG